MTMLNTFPNIPGYQIVKIIDRGAVRTVYQGVRNGESYAIKYFHSGPAEPESSLKQNFFKEAALLARIQHPGIVKVLEISDVQSPNPYLVFEHVEGETLTKKIERGPLPDAVVKTLAKNLAEALFEVHRIGLVHRDLTPNNIIIQPNGMPKIIDFGIAMPLRKTLEGESSDSIAGTLIYSAPEQIGIIRHNVNGRSDLYSLGCILFECTTGQVPFQCENFDQLLHRLAVERSPDPSSINAGLSRPLSLMIQKLMSKDPEDRYMSARHLIADLEKIEILEFAVSRGESITLGVSGKSSFNFELPIVGREKELLLLFECWRRTLKGVPQTVIIDGPSGSGKSRLARELLKQVRHDGALLLTGKCELECSTPLGVIREALDRFLIDTKKLPDEEKNRIFSKIRSALGRSAPLLKNMSNELNEILTDVKDAIDAQEPQIFFTVIATFLVKLSENFPALVLYVDDVQWIDEASQEVLIRFIKLSNQNKVMTIVSYRSEDDYQEHIKKLLNSIQSVIRTCVRIRPLASEAIFKFIQNFLGGGQLPSQEFVQRIEYLSQGYPLSIEEYLQVMLDSGCLCPYWGTWKVDLSKIESLNLSHDVVQIMLRRIRNLEDKTQEVLKVASVVGTQFEKSILEKILDRNVDYPIQQSFQAHLLEQDIQGNLRFIHDRIQESLLSSVSKENLKEIHQKAAEAIDSISVTDKCEKKVIYALARHYAHGFPERNPSRAYDINFLAGEIALESFSHREAAEFFRQAQDLESRFKLNKDSVLLLERQAETALKVNAYPEAIRILNQMLDIVKGPLQRAGIYSQLVNAYGGTTDLMGSLEALVLGLKELGIKGKGSRTTTLISAFRFGIVGYFLHKTKFRFGTSHGAARQRDQLICNIYFSGMSLLMLTNQKDLAISLLFRVYFNAHFLGVSPELAMTYASCAMVAGSLKMRSELEKYSRHSLNIAYQLGDPLLTTKVKGSLSIASFLCGDYFKSEILSQECMGAERQWLLQGSMTFVSGQSAHRNDLQGNTREAKYYLDQLIPRRDSGESLKSPMTLIGRASCKAILGDIQGALEDKRWAESILSSQQVEDHLNVRLFITAHLISFRLETDGSKEEIQNIIDKNTNVNLSAKGTSFGGYIYFSTLAYARLKFCFDEWKLNRRVSSDQQMLLERALKELKQCRHPLTNHHYWVGVGALYWFKGKYKKAIIQLNLAEEKARLGGNPRARYEALRCRAGVYSDLNQSVAFNADAKVALSIAEEQGWVGRARRLKKDFGLDEFNTNSYSLSQNVERDRNPCSFKSYKSYKSNRDLEALLQLNRASLHMGTLEEQARFALDEVIKLLNAERGFLFVFDKEESSLKTWLVRDYQQQDLSKDSSFSQTIVQQVLTSRESFIFKGDKNGKPKISESIVVHRLRSIMASPLMIEEKLLGVLYVDSTIARGLFQQDELELLEAISGLLAVNLEAAKTRILETEKNLLKKEQELSEARIKSAHAAGMAEIATGTIHNIGNAMTPIMMNFDLLKEKMRTSAIVTVIKGCQLLKQNEDDLVKFITEKPNGIPLLKLLMQLGPEIEAEQRSWGERLKMMGRSLENVKNVILMQQEYAKIGLHLERVNLNDCIEEVLGLQSAKLNKQNIEIRKEYSRLSLISVQKNKLLNVLINLINNAKDAMEELPVEQRVIRISTKENENQVDLKIADAGVGIAAENLQKIFNHGFTTKKGGHGFGLHVSAITLNEIGGQIHAESPGVGKGATFIVSFSKKKCGADRNQYGT